MAAAAPEDEIRADSTIGEYVVDGPLGRGGFGAVYRAHHPLIGKRVAIKVLDRAFSTDAEIASRFVSEARAVNEIGHRNIIDIFSFGLLPDGRQYYVMELLAGRTFTDYLREKGPLSVEAALPILRQVGVALDAAHAHGIAHRDLKPDNIFITDVDGAPFVKLLDFGIAKLMRHDDVKHKTESGAPMGTPSYMSPEQCQGSREIDHRTDIYSFGILAYQALTAQLPFDGDSFIEICSHQMYSDAKPPSAIVSTLRPHVDAAIAAMLEKKPEHRPSSLAHAVAMLGGEETVPERPELMPTVRNGPRVETTTTRPTAVEVPHEPTVMPVLTHAGRNLAIAAVATVVVVGGGIAAFVLTRAPAASEKPPEVARRRIEKPVEPPVDAAVAAESVIVAPVRLTFVIEPADAQIVDRTGAVVAGGHGTLEVPKSSTEMSLTVRRDGFQPQALHVVPDRDKEFRNSLTRIVVPAVPVTPPAGSATGSGTLPKFDDKL